MKRKQLIVNLSLMMAVLFAMLFQSFHSYEHLGKLLSQKQCHHKYNLHKTEITHAHHNFDHCFVCEFTFGSFLAPEKVSYKVYAVHKAIPYFFVAPKAVISFSGSQYLLRGPPLCIV
jgi:hypothetical protein